VMAEFVDGKDSKGYGKWKVWDGDYEKTWYDVMLGTGEVLFHCWPNAGVMCACDGSGRMWEPGEVLFRTSGDHPLDKIEIGVKYV